MRSDIDIQVRAASVDEETFAARTPPDAGCGPLYEAGRDCGSSVRGVREMDVRREVVVITVAEVDRAKDSSRDLGRRLDTDVPA
jgi:hypothetical protein